MEPGQSLYVEKYGDAAVLFDKTGEGTSVEVKKYEGDLTPLHHNILNTLFNWCQENFHQENFQHLLLMTTQTVEDSSKLATWDKLDGEKRYEMLETLYKDHKEKYLIEIQNRRKENPDATLSKGKQETLNQIDYLLADENRGMIKSVLGKCKILYSQPDFLSLYNRIKHVHAAHLDEKKKDLYIANLLGLIICPSIVENGWKISRSEFESIIKELTNDFTLHKVFFPRIEDPSAEEKEGCEERLFVRKLKKAQLDMQITQAISDYVKTNSLILKHISGRLVRDQYLQQYKEDMYDMYRLNYNIAVSNLIYYDKEEDVIKATREFYQEMMNSCCSIKLAPFDNVWVYFAHGIMHILADDESLDVKWEIIDEANN